MKVIENINEFVGRVPVGHEMVVMETESLPYQYWIKKG